MQNYKLANVLLQLDDHLADCPNVLYRTENPVSFCEEDNSLTVSGAIDFTTYFNGFSLGKWRQYTVIDNAWLHIEIKGGPCELSVVGEALEGNTVRHVSVMNRILEASEDYQAYDLQIPFDDSLVVGFVLDAEEEITLSNVYYYAAVNDEDIRPVNLALCTTTFKKEGFIVPNIARIKEQILACDDPISEHFHMFVVDNGRTLDKSQLQDSGVTIIPNNNVGGSGGFARGMMAATEPGTNYTHALLMDDDVKVSPESLIRTFNLLSLAKDEYKDAFLNGAMLALEQPNLQFEDISYVRNGGGYDRVKPDLYIDTLEDTLRNEQISVEVPQAYGAWWYDCIPTAAIREHGLPLPLFVRCDDVEYGMRCNPTYMTMNGICVWHSQFEGRFKASVDLYQYARNLLITIAVDDCSTPRTFMMRYWRIFHIYLRMMDYNAVELWLDALRDYLKGPEFLEKVDGQSLMMENGARNEKLVPLNQLDQDVVKKVTINKEELGFEPSHSPFFKVMESLPHDRHMLPDALLSDEPAMVYYCKNLSPWYKTAARKTLLALDATGEKGAIRRMDRKRYNQLTTRYKELKKEYDSRAEQVAAEYKDAMPRLTSRAFWEEYLAR